MMNETRADRFSLASLAKAAQARMATLGPRPGSQWGALRQSLWRRVRGGGVEGLAARRARAATRKSRTHNTAQECARRRRQIAQGMLRPNE